MLEPSFKLFNGYGILHLFEDQKKKSTLFSERKRERREEKRRETFLNVSFALIFWVLLSCSLQPPCFFFFSFLLHLTTSGTTFPPSTHLITHSQFFMIISVSPLFIIPFLDLLHISRLLFFATATTAVYGRRSVTTLTPDLLSLWSCFFYPFDGDKEVKSCCFVFKSIHCSESFFLMKSNDDSSKMTFL